ncbi:MAG: AAA family ATPase [Planctomycetota bacterium]
MGLQGAGKTSFVRARLAGSHVHVSKDLYSRTARKKGARQAREVEAALGAGRAVVVDNTNLTRAERGELLELGRRHGASATGYYFRSVLAECLERNDGRSGRARVPEVAVRAASQRLKLPSLAEGFAALFYVRLTEEGGFELSPWKEEP